MTTEPAIASNASTARTILIVDDDVFSRNVFARTLQRRGHRVLHTDTAKQAAQIVRTQCVDLVVVDGLLPDCDSIRFVAKLRKARGQAQIIYLASVFRDDSEEYRRLTDDLDVALVLHKPISPVEFSIQVSNVLGLSGEIGLDVSSSVVDEAESMRQRYTETVESKLLQLERTMRSLRQGARSLQETREFVRQLRGTASRYGFFDIAEAAGRIEEGLVQIGSGEARAEQTLWNAIFEALDEALIASRVVRERARQGDEFPSHRFTATILAVDDDVDVLSDLQELGRQNFVRVLCAQRREEVLDKIRDPALDGIIMDTHLCEGCDAFALVREIRERAHGRKLPIAFMADHGALHDRVEAAHAGAALFVDKPVDTAQFSDVVHYLVSLNRADRPTILIVDDDPEFVAETSKILEDAQMHAVHLDDTTTILETLERVNPEGVILDIAMPKIGGFDVCRMLRAVPRWHDLPVLFVANRMNARTRLAAFRAGGDDYLVKPLVREELLARLQVRLDRLKLLKERADRDVLTGLLTRRAFMQRVTARLSEVRRRGQALAFCLIDLDHFKEVNDAYGHIAGDRVLSAFGKLLANRFRMADLRGRWGGEEFVVALVDEDRSTAKLVLERILEEFSQMEFDGDSGGRFSVTFSAGIAEYQRDGDDFEALLRAADRRLYAAKQAGRNRIFVSSPP